MTQRLDWTGAYAPSLADFDRIAAMAFEGLPALFREKCAGVVIRTTDFPDNETLDALECETEFDLLGLFTGIGLAHQGVDPESGQLPNSVFLYRRPILDYWAEHEETLGAIITHVLIHELGHHLGFSDEDMDAIEAAAG